MNNINKLTEEIIKLDLDNPIEYMRQQLAPHAINKLNSLIANCTKCKQISHEKRLYYGNPDANYLIITDNATFDNNIYDYLKDLLIQVEIDINDVFIVNAISCININKINENSIRLPTYSEISNCVDYVKHAIDIVKPRVIISMGATSLNLFRNCSFKEEISSWIQIKDIPAIITYSSQDIYYFSDKGYDQEELEDYITVIIGDLLKAKNYLEGTIIDE